MNITTNREGNTLTIAVEGKLDTYTAPEQLILDFEKLQYLSSAGLRVLLSAMQTMDDQGTLTVKNINNFVREILEETGLLEDLDIA